MICVLILVFRMYTGDAHVTAMSVEFNNRKACEAAALELRQQANNNDRTPIIFCAAKG